MYLFHVHIFTHWLRPRNPLPPSPPHLDSYTRALLVSQDRQHLFMTPCRNTLKLGPLDQFVQYAFI
jgi:hypothetical protein